MAGDIPDPKRPPRDSEKRKKTEKVPPSSNSDIHGILLNRYGKPRFSDSSVPPDETVAAFWETSNRLARGADGNAPPNAHEILGSVDDGILLNRYGKPRSSDSSVPPDETVAAFWETSNRLARGADGNAPPNAHEILGSVDGSGLDPEDNPDWQQHVKLGQSRDSVESVDPSDPPGQIHYPVDLSLFNLLKGYGLGYRNSQVEGTLRAVREAIDASNRIQEKRRKIDANDALEKIYFGDIPQGSPPAQQPESLSEKIYRAALTSSMTFPEMNTSQTDSHSTQQPESQFKKMHTTGLRGSMTFAEEMSTFQKGSMTFTEMHAFQADPQGVMDPREGGPPAQQPESLSEKIYRAALKSSMTFPEMNTSQTDSHSTQQPESQFKKMHTTGLRGSMTFAEEMSTFQKGSMTFTEMHAFQADPQGVMDPRGVIDSREANAKDVSSEPDTYDDKVGRTWNTIQHLTKGSTKNYIAFGEFLNKFEDPSYELLPRHTTMMKDFKLMKDDGTIDFVVSDTFLNCVERRSLSLKLTSPDGKVSYRVVQPPQRST